MPVSAGREWLYTTESPISLALTPTSVLQVGSMLRILHLHLQKQGTEDLALKAVPVGIQPHVELVDARLAPLQRLQPLELDVVQIIDAPCQTNQELPICIGLQT